MEVRISYFPPIDYHVYGLDLPVFDEERLDGRYAAGGEEEKEISKKADIVGDVSFFVQRINNK
ncbi:hypothetical protein STFR1_20434 [Bacillus vallismortis]